jgi:hypothetical protein
MNRIKLTTEAVGETVASPLYQESNLQVPVVAAGAKLTESMVEFLRGRGFDQIDVS